MFNDVVQNQYKIISFMEKSNEKSMHANLQIDAIQFKVAKISGQLDAVQEEINRSLLVQRESLDAAKPMKSNNWDSVREAFKGPTRVDINERN